MSSLNKVMLIGRMGKDPDARFAASGDAVTTISVATEESWKDKAGAVQKKVEWSRVVFFGKLAEVVGKYTQKGSLVYIEGRLSTRKWADREGKDHYTTEIVGSSVKFLDSKAAAPASSTPAATEKAAAPAKAPATAGGFEEMDDDIPF